MAIEITKTLQAVEYVLYIITKIDIDNSEDFGLSISQDIYQSQGHYTDEFLPIIRKYPTVSSRNARVAIRAVLQEDYNSAVQATEQFLITAGGFYEGGEIVA